MKKQRSAVRPQGLSFGGGEGRGGEGRGREVLVFTLVFDLLLRYAKVIKKKMDLRCNILACLQMAEGNAQIASGST